MATACGLATLHEISKPGFFEALGRADAVAGRRAWRAAARDAGVPLVGDSEGGMFGFFFRGRRRCRRTTRAVMATDKERFNRFFHAMLDRGVYLAPALYEAGFVSAAHGEAEIARDASPRRPRCWPPSCRCAATRPQPRPARGRAAASAAHRRPGPRGGSAGAAALVAGRAAGSVRALYLGDDRSP